MARLFNGLRGRAQPPQNSPPPRRTARMCRGSLPAGRQCTVCELAPVLVHVVDEERDAARAIGIARERDRLGNASVHASERRLERVRDGFRKDARVVHERLAEPDAPGRETSIYYVPTATVCAGSEA
jgi:hypothetical protein